jgi:branched-chain amino acid aminotransferase
VLSPVGRIWFDDAWHQVGEGDVAGPVMHKLYDLLVGIQKGELEDEFGWTVAVD